MEEMKEIRERLSQIQSEKKRLLGEISDSKKKMNKLNAAEKFLKTIVQKTESGELGSILRHFAG